MIDVKPPEESTAKAECIEAIRNELHTNDDTYTEVKTELLREVLNVLTVEEPINKVLNPDAYYLKEISNTLKDILREMRKRKV